MNKNESLVSKVNALRGKGMNLADACEKVGIKLATYGYYQKKKEMKVTLMLFFMKTLRDLIKEERFLKIRQAKIS